MDEMLSAVIQNKAQYCRQGSFTLCPVTVVSAHWPRNSDSPLNTIDRRFFALPICSNLRQRSDDRSAWLITIKCTRSTTGHRTANDVHRPTLDWITEFLTVSFWNFTM
jgi:hypothetical protein